MSSSGAGLGEAKSGDDRGGGWVDQREKDGIIFADCPQLPGVPVIYRTREERANNPERLNLDRRGLTVCPVLEGEERLRLLNFQNNSIAAIDHLHSLPNLIFLDLYNNMLTEIQNLEVLPSLRVLMLGKNRISKICNLDCLRKLEVLDLHSNKIPTIENLNRMTELRVLNLAGNQIEVVGDLPGLTALTEFNLRRNKIREARQFYGLPHPCPNLNLSLHNVITSQPDAVSFWRHLDALPNLQRLFLSNNQIESFVDVDALFVLQNLMELTMDSNPVAGRPHYRQSILDQVRSLRLLDLQRISDEERRLSHLVVKKEEEKAEADKRKQAADRVREQAISEVSLSPLDFIID